MTRGLLASIIRFSSLGGKLPYDIAVLEIDEAYAAKLAPVLRPRACILTNVLRDQLDRFGEIDHTAELLKTLAAHTAELVAYNICDPRLRSFPIRKTAKRVSYGYSDAVSQNFKNDDDWHADSHPKAQPLSDYTLMAFDSQKVEITCMGNKRLVNSQLLPGAHNALNLTAVVAFVSELYRGHPTNFANLRPPYGRGEVVVLGEKKFTLQLVKNPAGFGTAMTVGLDQPAMIVINDAIADSRDVSWLWDVDVSLLGKRPNIYVSGTRAYDMANRLKYAEITTTDIENDVEKSLKKFMRHNDNGVIFLTYTAMLRVRKLLSHMHKEGKA
jgi:UDP-N-acetylmuramyl tripeptide synthase